MKTLADFGIRATVRVKAPTIDNNKKTDAVVVGISGGKRKIYLPDSDTALWVSSETKAEGRKQDD